ncbi:MAG: hypothetical protein WAL50_12475 [Kineosporiaceae bacterium]
MIIGRTVDQDVIVLREVASAGNMHRVVGLGVASSLALLVAAVALGVCVTVGVERWRAAWNARPLTPVREAGHHVYLRCGGCGARVVRARCDDGRNRFFNVDPVKMDAPDLVYPHGESTGAIMAWRARTQQVEEANAQLWLFDPSVKMAMVRFRPHLAPLPSEGLSVHFCALGQRHEPLPSYQDKVRWQNLMTGGDYLGLDEST